MKKVVLAEKPSVARDIAKVLKCQKKGDGFLEGNQYIVTWALGHLVTLADPDYYDKKYAQWNLEHLPMLPQEMKTVVMKQTSKQFYAVKKQLLRKDVDEIIIATDAGREGELVARLILKEAKPSGEKLSRLWISSNTDKAILEGFRKLKPASQYNGLYASAFARSMADWYVGMNATRALTTKYNAQLSSGRVQTPTLAMIAEREQAIREFVSKEYYGVQLLVGNLIFHWVDKKNAQSTTFDYSVVEAIQEKIQNQPLQIVDITKKTKKQKADLLYDLTELQRDANTKFGYSAKQTLTIMQGLYEKHKMLSYPRTDSRYITSDIVGTIKERLQGVSVGAYASHARQLLQKPITVQSNIVNNNKVTDHHAIIPTEIRANLAALNDAEKRIYDLVVKRFFSVLSPEFVFEQTTVIAEVANERFKLQGKKVLDFGWKQIYGTDEMDAILPALEKGEQLEIDRISIQTNHTKAPSRFSEATLLSAMEAPGKYVQGLSKEVITMLNEAGGIGTVATRADIIDKLFASFVIELKDKTIYLTPKGKQLLELAPSQLTSPILTAQWEGKLKGIESGKVQSDAFINEIRAYTKELVADIKQSKATFKHQNVSTKVCDDCGAPMLEVNGKRGKMLVCSDRECGARKKISTVSNARCPECKKKMELFGDGEKRIFVCRCGYREKLSSFEKRRKAEKGTGSASKNEVRNYMNKQKKEEQQAPNAFASAFSKLKIDTE